MFKARGNSIAKRRGRWDKAKWKNIGQTYRCPICNNRNTDPLKTADGSPYCSNCLIKSGSVVIMLKLNVQQKKSKHER